MPTHDLVIENGTGAAVRSDLNDALAAIVSNSSNATAPATTYSYQWWADTTTGLLKIRNAANSAFVTVGTLSATNLGLAALAGATFTGDVVLSRRPVNDMMRRSFCSVSLICMVFLSMLGLKQGQ